MNLTAQRGAIPIILDRPRVLFYSAAETWLLVERYGVGFTAELYTVDPSSDPESSNIRLLSSEALQFFLWAGLQAEAKQRGETLTIEQAEEFIRPWSITMIFHCVIQAITGAHYAPAVKVGNAGATSLPASPAAKKSKPSKKASTLKTRSGLRLQR